MKLKDFGVILHDDEEFNDSDTVAIYHIQARNAKEAINIVKNKKLFFTAEEVCLN